MRERERDFVYVRRLVEKIFLVHLSGINISIIWLKNCVGADGWRKR